MTRSFVVSGVGVLCLVALAFANPSLAQSGVASILTAPDYDSGVWTGPMSDARFNTPASDGRPGVKFFTLGVQAFKQGDYRHAIDMYKVAASWAYKPAEYNLGVMYFKGQGAPVDRPLGAAWMVLAAERGDAPYVKARDLMVTVLTKGEFARTDELWNELKPTYGDKVALRRAKAQWAWAKSQQTGSRVGGQAGNLQIGVLNDGHTPKGVGMDGKSASVAANGFSLMQGGSVDGSVAYREFQQSANPYDPAFRKNRAGTVTVEPLQPRKPGTTQQDGHSNGASQPPPSSSRRGA